MGIDVQWGNVRQEDAERMARAVWDGDLREHVAGATEPYISRLVADFVIATGARSVLETGGYLGDTSLAIAKALIGLGSGHLLVCEIEAARCDIIAHRLAHVREEQEAFGFEVYGGDIMDHLRSTDDRYDVAWVDDSHTEKHVREEMELLYPKMGPGGLILLHDVAGLCPGNQYPLGRICNEFGGYVLNLPRWGPAGGLGIIQTPLT